MCVHVFKCEQEYTLGVSVWGGGGGGGVVYYMRLDIIADSTGYMIRAL